jgi:oligopeptide transport system substrate-binding protein
MGARGSVTIKAPKYWLQEVEMSRHPVFIVFLAALLAVILTGSNYAPALLQATAATAVTPSVLRMPVASDPKGFEPALAVDLVSLWIAENLHAGLVRYDFRGRVEPYLAEKYQISPDGRIYTFTLRQGIKWQNGRPIVASDFKKGWERYLDPKIPAQLAPDYLGGIRGAKDVIEGRTRNLGGVQAVDDRTLRITLVNGDPSFLLRLASAVTLGGAGRGRRGRQARMERQAGGRRSLQVRGVEEK